MRNPKVSKQDANHKELSEALIRLWGGIIRDYYNIGWPGHPDILHATECGATLIGRFSIADLRAALAGMYGVDRILPGANVYWEFKTAKGRVDRDQRRWICEHPGPVLVARTLDEVLRYTGEK